VRGEKEEMQNGRNEDSHRTKKREKKTGDDTC
jgi:hypothetical protein